MGIKSVTWAFNMGIFFCIFSMATKISRQITSCWRWLFPPQRFCVTQSFLRVLTAHSHPCSYRTWHSLPPSAGQASALLLQPTLLAHPSARLFTAPCPYPSGSHSVALSKEFLQQSPRALSQRRRQLSACYSSVTMHKRMGLCHEIDDDSFNRNKLNLVI